MSVRLSRLAAFLALVCVTLSLPAGEPAAKEAPETLKPEERIRRALVQPTELHVSETRLDDVVDLLKDKHKIEMQLDKKALDDVGIATDTPVTKSLKGISLRSALRLILHELDLTYMVKDEVLLITTQEVADSCLELKVYDVADMAPAGAEAAAFFEQLTAAITGCIRPQSFDAEGGPGTIRKFDAGGIRAIVVSQSQEIHDEIADLLAKLREVRRAPPGGPQPAKQPADAVRAAPAVSPKVSAGDEAIRRALAKPIAVDFRQKPLADAVAVLQEKAGVPIVLDKRALDDEGTADDTPVTAKFDGLKLKSVLDLLLKPLKLTWTVRGDAVQITTADVAESALCSRVYDVADFPAFRNARGEPVPDYDALISAITAAIQPQTWEGGGGPCSIQPLEGPGVQTLVICHAWPVHEDIERLLSNLRKVRGKPLAQEDVAKLPPAPPRKRHRTVTE